MAATTSARKHVAGAPARPQRDGARGKARSGEQPAQSRDASVVYTVGHSTRALEDFIALLAAHGVQRLIDVRTVPRSRHNPQFNRDTLPQSLQAAGIGYSHMAGLGGLRKPRADSVNAAWRNLSFRGYADYMQTSEFAHSLDELLAAADSEQVALMCAEAVPWRCHRSLIADALLARGVRAEELVDAKRREPHRLTPFAVVDGSRLTYPPIEDAPRQSELFLAPPSAPRRSSARARAGRSAVSKKRSPD